MTMSAGWPGKGTGLLRARDGQAQRVTNMELFFDLVYVFAVTQLSRQLLEHLTPGGAFDTLLLLLAVWWAWIYTAWVTNWCDPNHSAVRVVLLGVMLSSLVMSAAIPDAFGGRGLMFAGAYVAIQVGRSLFMVLAPHGDPGLRRNFQRILVWSAASGVLWIVGALLQGATREALWLAAVIVDYLAPASGFFTPGLGRSTVRDWRTITGGHIAERCQQFILIALGESVLDTGATLGELTPSTVTVVAFVVAFIGNVALWWVYFYRSAEWGSERISSDREPGRLGRTAYTYFHLPMVAGIIVAAVAIELTISHPLAHGAVATAAVSLGGPALYLAGHALFKRAISGHLSWSRIIAIAALAAMIPVAAVSPILLTSAAAGFIVVLVACWDTYALRARAAPVSG